MGFAYAQGMVRALKDNSIEYASSTVTNPLDISWDGYYIFAAENAGTGIIDPVWSKAQVWQYGSNLGETDADPLYLQDGVAPQAPIKGIGQRRVFIPAESPSGLPIPKNFLDSHSIENYWWVFERKLNERGFINEK